MSAEVASADDRRVRGATVVLLVVVAAGAPTQWTNPAHDYPTAPDGASPWASAAEPAAVLPAVAPVTERGRLADGRAIRAGPRTWRGL